MAIVGAGGKTEIMFALAREFAGPVLITTTTHLGAWQVEEADAHVVASQPEDLTGLRNASITVITGPLASRQRFSAAPPDVLKCLRQVSLNRDWPLFIEADGARQRPLKAPGEHEPQIPDFVEIVAVVAGMHGLGRLLDASSVHRPELFSEVSGLAVGSRITGEAVASLLTDTRGGLKSIPARARRIAVLNQADSPLLQSEARRIADSLQESYDATITANAAHRDVHAVREPVAGIILAAGAATRFGRPKQIVDWHGESLIRRIARQASAGGLSPVIVVTGASAHEVEAALEGLPVMIVRNTAWQAGQSSSIKAGLAACPPSVCAAVFLLADQPFITPALIQAVVDAHASESAAIVAPLIAEDRRGNPVLFDREAFPDLRTLNGDEGGRAAFAKHRVHYVPWHDDMIGRDIDTESDYLQLREAGLAD